MTKSVQLLCACMLTLLAAVVFCPPAGAHEGGGTITVETTEPAPDGSVRYVARLIWNNDNHPAAAADTTLTATLVNADDLALTPVTLTPVDDDGRFETTVEFPDPGVWTVRFTAISPEATLEIEQDIAAPPTTTTTTEAAETTTTIDTAATTAPEADDQDEGGTSAGVVVFGVALLVILGAAIYIGTRARRHRQTSDDTSASSPTEPEDLS